MSHSTRDDTSHTLRFYDDDSGGGGYNGAWEQQSQQHGLYGERGWSVRAGLWGIIAQCHAAMYESSALKLGYRGEEPLIVDGVPRQDYTPFHHLGVSQARQLLEILPAAQLRDRQNFGPSLRCALQACLDHPHKVWISGYAIGPQRHDERITVEGIWINDPEFAQADLGPIHSADCECLQVWRRARERYSLDAVQAPSEMRLEREYWLHGPLGVWMWWD